MSLLAIAVDQPLPMLNDPPLSRAGSLLQLDEVHSVRDWSAGKPAPTKSRSKDRSLRQLLQGR
ncbi:hypothetical protein C3E98_009455 [Pseudomonas sp. MWU13-2625]|nr:hypothetical protein C3E98_009455 [Pseudomonas sp. MWU13-2625]